MMSFRGRGDAPAAQVVWVLAKDVFYLLAITCILSAAHRIASGVLLGGRISALREVGPAYTPEEREELIHKIKRASLRC